MDGGARGRPDIGPAARADGNGDRSRGGSRCGRRGQVTTETGHEVDLGEGFAQLVPVALGHAAGHDEP